MIRTFFERQLDERGESVDTSRLFADKKIWAEGEKYRQLQGRNPVIWLSFKDLKATSWEDAIEIMMRDVGSEISRHIASVENGWDDGAKKDQMRRIVNRSASFVDLTASLCYRVAKEGILSGLNNLRVYTVFDPEFSEYFGFTEDEVTAMADYYGVPEKMDEIRDWYDGYDFGGTEIFNPRSVLNYFDRGCRPAPYWLDKSSNELITEIVRNLPHDIARTLEALLRDGKVRVPMAEELGPYLKPEAKIEGD